MNAGPEELTQSNIAADAGETLNAKGATNSTATDDLTRRRDLLETLRVVLRT
jgi:hypothetical protein